MTQSEIEGLRRVVKTIDNSFKFHLAASTDIAAASVCGWKFRLPRIMGVVPKNVKSYVPGSLVHNVLENFLPDLIDFWKEAVSIKNVGQVKDGLIERWSPVKDKIFKSYKSRVPDADGSISTAENRLERIAEALAFHLIENPVPNRILTEVFITNPKKFFEGRIDAIFEYNGHAVTMDWKTYKDSNVSKYDAIQSVVNGMLVNYRYGRDETDFTNNELKILLLDGVHKVYPTEKRIDEVSETKTYVLKCLRNEPIRTQMPFVAVCANCNYLEMCEFYRRKPSDQTDLERRRRAWKFRYHILDERAKAQKYKFYAAHLTPKQLERFGIASFGYETVNFDEKNSELIINGPEPEGLFEGNSVRVIGMENGIPLLACVNCAGGIRQINGNELKVNIFVGNVKQLLQLPIALLRSEVDLTKADLQAIDLVERRRPDLQFIADSFAGIR